jgi:hypothetical protein
VKEENHRHFTSTGRHPAGWIAVAGVFCATLALHPLVSILSNMFTFDRWYLMDEGTILYAAFRSATGFYPHLDGPYYYSGGLEIMLGWIFRCCGIAFSVARFTLATTMATTAALVFVLLTRLAIDRWLAVLFAILGTALAFGMNYHCYPAWYALPPILAAILFFWNGIRRLRPSYSYLLSAGILLGLSISVKQTMGLFTFLAFTLASFLILPQASTETSRTVSIPQGKAMRGIALLGIIPILILVAFTVLIGSRLTLINIVMFLVVPGIYVGYSLAHLRGLGDAPETLVVFPRILVGVVIALGTGVILGLLPLASFYALHAGLGQFIADSFLNVRGAVEGSYSEFKFVNEDATANVFVFLRWFLLFLLPLAISVIAFVISRKQTGDQERRGLLAIVSFSIAILYFTLFPIAIRMYVLFLVPLLLVPAAYSTDILLKRLMGTVWKRALVVGVGGCVLLGAYVGARSLAGDLQHIAYRGSYVLSDHTGDVALPKESYTYIEPVVRYMEARPAGESSLTVDIFNKLIGFLSQKPVLFDHLRQHHSLSITEDDLNAMVDVLRSEKVDMVVIGRDYLVDPSQEKRLERLLLPRYTIAIKNDHHIIFQKVGQ